MHQLESFQSLEMAKHERAMQDSSSLEKLRNNVVKREQFSQLDLMKSSFANAKSVFKSREWPVLPKIQSSSVKDNSAVA